MQLEKLLKTTKKHAPFSLSEIPCRSSAEMSEGKLQQQKNISRKKSDLCQSHLRQQLAPDVDLRMMPIVSEVEYRGWAAPSHLVGRRNSANIGYNQFIQD